MDKPRPSVLLGFMLPYVAASLLHHVHNAEFLDEYPHMPAWLSPALVYGAWLGLTATGLASHYALAPFSAHTFTMNMTIWLEAATALLLLTAVMSVMLRRLPRPQRR